MWALLACSPVVAAPLAADPAGRSSCQLYRSVDDGASWQRAGPGLPVSKRINAYAALYSKGLYRIDRDGARCARVGEVVPLEFLIRGDSLIAGHHPGGALQSSDEDTT